jgi:hypothetical protein
MKPNIGRSSTDNTDSILLHLQSSRAFIVLHTGWCPAGGSPGSLSGVYTWGLGELSYRFRGTITELNLSRSPPLNLGINNRGVVIHLWWHNPNSGRIASSTRWSSDCQNLMPFELKKISCNRIGLPELIALQEEREIQDLCCPPISFVVCEHNWCLNSLAIILAWLHKFTLWILFQFWYFKPRAARFFGRKKRFSISKGKI